MIDIKAIVLSETQQKDLLKAFESADIIVCTSWYGAEYFLKEIASSLKNAPRNDTPRPEARGFQFVTNDTLGKKIFAVIGRRTQEALQEYGIQPAVVSQEETAEGLLKAMKQHLDLQDKRILFPRSSLPNPFLKEALTVLGARVSEMTIYENTKPAKRDLPSINIDGVIFTSPSTVRNFLTDYGTIPASWQIMAKGPVTLKTLQEAGYNHAASLS
jgi:uroporphyrinogen-III synthase